jgi:putative aldouronate transport system substrate-binding protein
MKKTLALFLALSVLLCALPGALAEDALPTLKVLAVYNGHDPNNDPTALAIEEKTGYHMEYYMLPSENDTENLLLQIASGESYDILRISETQYLELLSRGALLPLDDLLAAYGQNLTSLITADAYSLSTSEGKIYGIPMMAERASISSGIVLRADIMEALGLSNPTTPSEFKAVLEAVKTAYPDMIPFLTSDEQRIDVISSGFGFYFDWNDVDGQLTHYVELPAYQDYLAYIADLYASGLIDPDIAINNSTLRTEKFSSGNVFAYTCSGWTDAPLTAFINADIGEVIYLDPFVDANGKAGIKKQQALNNISCIPITAANPEHAVRLMNRKLDSDVFTYVTLGTEGETFTIDEHGGYWPIMPIFTELRNNAWWYLNSFDMTRYGDMWMARTRRTEAVAEIYDGLNQHEDLYAVSNPLDLCPTLEAVTQNKLALATMVSDYVLQVIVGVKKAEDHQVFLNEWLASGGQACKDAYNGWYANR